MRRALFGLVLSAVLAAGGTAAAAADKVSVAALTFTSSGALFIAQERGYFAQQGLEVEFKFFKAAQPIAVAVASGDADFGVTGLTGGFFNLAGKGALKIVAAQSREQPGFDFVAYLASNQAFEKGLTEPAKFPGHSVGITQVGSTFHYMMGMLADKHGFKLDEVALKPLQGVPNMIAAVKTGQVDGILLPAHIAKPLAAKGEAKIIGWVQKETPWQLGALFTSAKHVADDRKLVERFVAAYRKGCEDFHAAFNSVDKDGGRSFGKPAEDAVPILQKYVQPKPSLEVAQASAPYVDAEGRLDVGDIYRQVAWYQAQGMVDAAVDPRAFIDLSFVKGHYNLPK